jgi:hypothetical protein
MAMAAPMPLHFTQALDQETGQAQHFFRRFSLMYQNPTGESTPRLHIPQEAPGIKDELNPLSFSMLYLYPKTTTQLSASLNIVLLSSPSFKSYTLLHHVE